jgi:hypothetical protein
MGDGRDVDASQAIDKKINKIRNEFVHRKYYESGECGSVTWIKHLFQLSSVYARSLHK